MGYPVSAAHCEKRGISGALCLPLHTLPPFFSRFLVPSFLHCLFFLLSVHVHALIVFEVLCAMEFCAAFEDTCFPCAGIDLGFSLYDGMDSPVELIDSEAMPISPFEYPLPALPPFPLPLYLPFVVVCVPANVWEGNRLTLTRIYWRRAWITRVSFSENPLPTTTTRKWILLPPPPKTATENLNSRAMDLRSLLAPWKTCLAILLRRRTPVALPLLNQIPRNLYSSLFPVCSSVHVVVFVLGVGRRWLTCRMGNLTSNPLRMRLLGTMDLVHPRQTPTGTTLSPHLSPQSSTATSVIPSFPRPSSPKLLSLRLPPFGSLLPFRRVGSDDLQTLGDRSPFERTSPAPNSPRPNASLKPPRAEEATFPSVVNSLLPVVLLRSAKVVNPSNATIWRIPPRPPSQHSRRLSWGMY